jgi:hypothetical protein
MPASALFGGARPVGPTAAAKVQKSMVQRSMAGRTAPPSRARITEVPPPSRPSIPAVSPSDPHERELGYGDVTVSGIIRLPGPARDETERVLPAVDSWGDLGERPWRDVILEFLDREITGIVVVHAFREIRWGYFIDGCPIHYTGDHPHSGEYLSDILRAEGLLTDAQWKEAVRLSKVTGARPSDFLVERGWLTRRQLLDGLRKRAERITAHMLTANFGRWSYHPMSDVRYALPYDPVDVLPILDKAERRTIARMTDVMVSEAIEGRYDFHIQLRPERLPLLQRLALKPAERTVADDFLPAGWTSKELVAMRALPEHALVRFVLLLERLGIVRLVESEGEQSRRNSVERRLFRELRARQRMGPFEVLSCHWTSVQEEIDAGWARMQEEFGPDRYPEVRDERIAGLLRSIRELARERYEQLKTKDGRDEARKNRIEPSQRTMAVDLLHKQGEIEVFKARWGVVRLICERIVEMSPKDPGSQPLIEWARTLLKEPKVAAARGWASDFDGAREVRGLFDG